MKAAGFSTNLDSETNFPGKIRGEFWVTSPLWAAVAKRTVMHSLADGLQDLDVDGSRAAVISVVLELLFSLDALRPFHCCEDESRLTCDAWDDVEDVEGHDGGVHIDVVRVENFGIFQRGHDGFGEILGEGVFIGTDYNKGTTVRSGLRRYQSVCRPRSVRGCSAYLV